MRLDHIAFRVGDRDKTAAFLCTCFGYRMAEDLPDGFEMEFEDGTKAQNEISRRGGNLSRSVD